MTNESERQTLGIVGGGQLGRMMAIAAARLGIRCVVLSPEPDPPAADVAEHLCAGYSDAAAIEELARLADVITLEFENVDADVIEAVSSKVPVRPHPRILRITQDRLYEKEAVLKAGLATAPFRCVETPVDIADAVKDWGRVVVKTRRMGYDGKGQRVIDEPSLVEDTWRWLRGRAAVVEGWVAFEHELSVLVARDALGKTVVFDVPRNVHENNILRSSEVPSRLPAEVEASAQRVARQIAESLDYIGVLAVELFMLPDCNLIVNELAPRVHNSGHWTIDACVVSQFEEHVRAVMDLPLAAPFRHSDVVMENLIGDEVLEWKALAAEDGCAVHIYRKSEVRSGRKMGHITRLKRSDRGD